VPSNSDSSDVFVNVVSQNLSRDIKCEVIVADRRMTFLVDTGASANFLPLCNLPKTAVVSPTDKQLIMWNGTQVPVEIVVFGYGIRATRSDTMLNLLLLKRN